jgi:hypothetical protein
MKTKFHINIGRQVGAGGLVIGKKLSNILSIPYFDKELINIASHKSGIDKEFFKNADEAPNKFKTSLLDVGFGTGLGITNYRTDNIIGSDNLFNIQSDVIKEEASKGSAIFIGRCADYILRESKNTLNVFIYADLKDRIERIKQAKLINYRELSDSKLGEIIKKEDKKELNIIIIIPLKNGAIRNHITFV